MKKWVCLSFLCSVAFLRKNKASTGDRERVSAGNAFSLVILALVCAIYQDKEGVSTFHYSSLH